MQRSIGLFFLLQQIDRNISIGNARLKPMFVEIIGNENDLLFDRFAKNQFLLLKRAQVNVYNRFHQSRPFVDI